MNASPLQTYAKQSSVITILVTEEAKMCDISYAPYEASTHVIMCTKHTEVKDVGEDLLKVIEVLFESVWNIHVVPHSLSQDLPHWGQQILHQFKNNTEKMKKTKIDGVLVTSRKTTASLFSSEYGSSNGIEFLFHIDHADNPMRSMDDVLMEWGYL